MNLTVCTNESFHAYKSLDTCNYVLSAERDVSLMKYWTLSTHHSQKFAQLNAQYFTFDPSHHSRLQMLSSVFCACLQAHYKVSSLGFSAKIRRNKLHLNWVMHLYSLVKVYESMIHLCHCEVSRDSIRRLNLFFLKIFLTWCFSDNGREQVYEHVC